MKTLVVLFFILFCIAISNANAQSVSEKATLMKYYYLECNCNGQWDLLYGEVTIHKVIHTGKDGKYWEKWQYDSVKLVNLRTGEECKLNNVIEKFNGNWGVAGSTWEWHGNLKGNMGTHYLFTVVWDISIGMELVKYEAKCI